MNQAEFGEGLKYIKCFYTNWNLDINNPMVLSIWYENFKNIEFKAFQEIVKVYCFNNRFAPQSPFDLLDVIPKEYGIDEAWEIIFDTINRSKDNTFFKNTMYSKFPKLYPFVKNFDIEKIELDSFGNKCIGYILGRIFKREYKQYLDSLNVKIVNNQIINSSNKLLIENR